MSILFMLIVLILLFSAFTIVVIGVWYVMMKLQSKMEKNPFIRKINSQQIYCTECNKTFFDYESIKTEIGIYPCPYCAGKETTIYEKEE